MIPPYSCPCFFYLVNVGVRVIFSFQFIVCFFFKLVITFLNLSMPLPVRPVWGLHGPTLPAYVTLNTPIPAPRRTPSRNSLGMYVHGWDLGVIGRPHLQTRPPHGYPVAPKAANGLSGEQISHSFRARGIGGRGAVTCQQGVLPPLGTLRLQGSQKFGEPL